jgi:SSS family solute:Na+ symporter
VSAAGSVYERGLSGGSAEPFGYGLCIIFLGLFIAVPLWRMKITTLGDLFRVRYSRSVERLAVLLMVPTSVFWAAAQVRAFGQVLSAASGFDPALTVTAGAAVVVAYTIFGGLLADAWTDLVQGIALIVGLAVLFVVILRDAGSLGLTAIDPAKLRLFDTSARSPLGLIEDWAIPVVGSLVAAELVARVIAARSPRVARNATLAGGAMYLLVGLIPVTLGLLGLGVVPGLAEPEQVLPVMALQVLPTALYVVFAGALVSAILSTVDSALLSAGALVSHNIIVPLLGSTDERRKVFYARAAVVSFGVLAWVLARGAESVYSLVEEASAFGSAGIFTCCVMGLSQQRGGPVTAASSMLSGMIGYGVPAFVFDYEYAYTLSLLIAFVTFLVFMWLEPGAERRLGGAAGSHMLA